MIIERYLLRETGNTFLGVSVLLVLVYLSGSFIRILSDAAEGKFPVGIVMELFAFKGIGNLVYVLPLSFFLGVLLALGRLYKDSEMTALIACGVGPKRIYRAVGGLAFAVAVVLGGLALWLAPWSEEKAQQLLDAAAASSEIEGLEAGRFNQPEGGRHLIYVEDIDDGGKSLENVFAHGRDRQGKLNLLAADSGHKVVKGEGRDRYLVFVDGHRYEGQPYQEGFRAITFREHGILVREQEVVPSSRPLRAVPSGALLSAGEADDLAEFQWRISVPISTLLLGLLAVPLSRTSPRQGRYGKLFFGIIVFIVYNNMLTVARASLAKGEYGPEVGLWWVHLLMAVIVALVIWRQNRMPRPRGERWVDE